jgi:hypothetical protein
MIEIPVHRKAPFIAVELTLKVRREGQDLSSGAVARARRVDVNANPNGDRVEAGC